MDATRPELARFRDIVGRVKTVNMSGRALVEFDDYHLNVGWYDIDPEFLKVVDKPPPKAPKPEVKKAAPKKAKKAPPKKAVKKAAKKAPAKKSAKKAPAKKAKASKKAAKKKSVKRAVKKAAKKKTARPKAAKRELIDTGRSKQYVRRNARGTSFVESDNVGRSLAADRRSKAKTVAKRGQGDRGDRRR